MMQLRYYTIVFFSLLCWIFQGSTGYAQQTDTTDRAVYDKLERALEDFDPSDPNLESEQLTQYLQELAANPININTATVDDLLLIPGLNLKLARNIINYREEKKLFETAGDLVDVSGIGRVTLERIRPYVTVGPAFQLQKRLLTDYRYWTQDGEFEMFSRYQQTVQEQEGYRLPDSVGYVGSPIKYYQRLKYESDHISVNLTQEKDPGEQVEGPTQFDYNSWHLALKDIGSLRSFVVGDYALSFGQGLVLWSGGAFGKGRDVVNSVNRNERGINPYTSAQETNYNTGLAATYGGKLQVTGFYSDRTHSATTVDSTQVRMPTESGYHRTLTEIAKKGAVDQQLYGGRVRYETAIGFVGVTGYQTEFSKSIVSGDAIYQRHDFEGTSHSVLGADYRLIIGPAMLYGEVGRSDNGGWGTVAGLESELKSSTALSLGYRYYQPEFQSIMGNGFGETSGEPKNESGFYIGLQQEITPSIVTSVYFDQYRFMAPRFGLHQPTQGFDWLAQVEVELQRGWNFYVLGRQETKEDEYNTLDDMGRELRKLDDEKRSSIRAQNEYWVNENIRLRTRGEWIRSRKAGENEEFGYLIYQDVRFVPSDKLRIDGRISIFNTESFDTRLYQFENDLLYVMSNEMLYRQGQRMYILVSYEPYEFLDIWAKYGVTIIENEQTLGSGYNSINGNVQSDVGLQIRLTF